MTLVDTNILIYASFSDMAEHERAHAWIRRQIESSDVGLVLSWPVIYAFARLISSERIFGDRAFRVDQAWGAASAYVSQPNTRIVTAGPGHARIAGELALTPGLRSDDVPDVELAALAIEHGLALATRDSGFRRFSSLRVVDPIDQ